jgi:hypothetical protein
MYCFCYDYFYENYDSGYEFSDGVKYCNDWLTRYTLTNTLVIVVPLMIGLINFISKHLLRFMSYWEKKHNIPAQKLSAAIYIATISFLNLGVIVLLVNLKIEKKLPLPIL